jgi:hypothetical protein
MFDTAVCRRRVAGFTDAGWMASSIAVATN